MIIFNEIFYRPLYNLLVSVYNFIPDLGIAIILVTLLIKVLLIPLSKKQIESQKKMQELQPKIKEVQEKYKNDKEKQSRALIELYKTNKTNPLSGCLPLIVQIVILITLYRVFINGLNFNGGADGLYSFVKAPESINPISFGFLNLASPNIFLAVLAAAGQFIQTKMLMKTRKNDKPVKPGEKMDFAGMMNKQMLYLGPFLTLFIGVKFASGLILYWLASTIFMIVQQYFVMKKVDSEQKLIEAKKL